MEALLNFLKDPARYPTYLPTYLPAYLPTCLPTCLLTHTTHTTRANPLQNKERGCVYLISECSSARSMMPVLTWRARYLEGVLNQARKAPGQAPIALLYCATLLGTYGSIG
eukprot:1598131-Rhodomonas_salina.8